MELMPRYKHYSKVLLYDSLAVICFAGVIAFGWLPGPGGLPLLLAGLSLLAINHEWAKRWLETTRHKGTSLKKYLFPNRAGIKLVYDFTSTLIVAGGGFVAFANPNRLYSAVGVTAVCAGLTIFLLNRDRLDKLKALLKRHKKA